MQTPPMTAKDERIGFRVSRETKSALMQIARTEDRSLGQICELLLKSGIIEYEKDGSNYFNRVLARVREKNK